MFIIELFILIYSVILHEIAHGFVADKLGDPTARLSKRLTLNPIPHIDPLMTIALPFFLLLTGSPIIFGGAKPVPIDPFNFRDMKKDIALTALAGPATNIAIAIVFAALLRFGDLFVVNDAALSILQSICRSAITLNISLAIFNLIPIPPLDGFKILSGVLPDDIARELYGLERYGFIIIFALLMFFPGLIFGLIGPIIQNLTSLLLH